MIGRGKEGTGGGVGWEGEGRVGIDRGRGGRQN